MSDLLVPRPRRLEHGDGALRSARLALSDGNAEPAADLARGALERALPGLGFALAPASEPSAERSPPLRLTVDPALAREEYRLAVGAAGIEIAGGSAAGLYWGAQTLVQWLRLHRPSPGAEPAVPAVRVTDRPSLPHRGFLLDVSRNRVPTMRSLFALVDRISALKLNQLQLYTEHTFAYRGHEPVWRDASPLTPEEVRRLDDHCRQRAVELVPNQNSFGHLHRWLRHEPYRRLAECPEGIKHPFGDRREPFSLCPIDPGSLELLRDLYAQLLPCFASRQVNVGLDETLDLGRGRSAEACRQRGTGAVWVEFTRHIHALAAEHGRRIQLWGDMPAAHPELLAELPGDVVVLDWGYEADHPFAERAARLAAAGLDFYLCPGTSSWNSFGGRLPNALANLASAARAGAASGAAGLLITDWGDFGHLQPPPVSWLPVLAGAAFAWRAEDAADPAELPLARLLETHDREAPAGSGRLLTALGGLYELPHLPTGRPPMNSSALFKLVVFPERGLDKLGPDPLTRPGLEQVAATLDEVLGGIGALAPADEASALMARELAWCAAALALGCRLGRERLAAGGGSVAELPAALRRELAAEAGNLADELEPLWLARSRPGGLTGSRRRLERLGEQLRDGARLT